MKGNKKRCSVTKSNYRKEIAAVKFNYSQNNAMRNLNLSEFTLEALAIDFFSIIHK